MMGYGGPNSNQSSGPTEHRQLWPHNFFWDHGPALHLPQHNQGRFLAASAEPISQPQHLGEDCSTGPRAASGIDELWDPHFPNDVETGQRSKSHTRRNCSPSMPFSKILNILKLKSAVHRKKYAISRSLPQQDSFGSRDLPPIRSVISWTLTHIGATCLEPHHSASPSCVSSNLAKIKWVYCCKPFRDKGISVVVLNY